EMRHREHTLAYRVAAGAIGQCVGHPRRFITSHARQLGRVGIQPLCRQHVRKTQPGHADTDAHLARPGLGIGRLPHLPRPRPAPPGDPDRPPVPPPRPRPAGPGYPARPPCPPPPPGPRPAPPKPPPTPAQTAPAAEPPAAGE